MADYPAIPYVTHISPRSKPQLADMTDGTVRVVRPATKTLYRLNVTHNYITRTQLNALRTFLRDNRTTDIDITATDGVDYRGHFVVEDYRITALSPIYYRAIARLLANLR